MKRKKRNPSFSDRSITITTLSGKKVTWTPREAIEGPYRVRSPARENKTEKAKRKVRQTVEGQVFTEPRREMRWWAKDKASEELGEQGGSKNSLDTIAVPPLLLDEAKSRKKVFWRLRRLFGSRFKPKARKIKKEQKRRSSEHEVVTFTPSLITVSPRPISPRGRRATPCLCCGATSPLARNPATYYKPRITSQDGLRPRKKGERPVKVYLPRGARLLLSDCNSGKEVRAQILYGKESEIGESQSEENGEIVNVNRGMAGQQVVNLSCRGGSGGSSQGFVRFSTPSNSSTSLPKISRLQRPHYLNRNNRNTTSKLKSKSWPSLQKIIKRCIPSHQIENPGRPKSRRFEFVHTNSISQESLIEVTVNRPLYFPRPSTPHSPHPKKYFITGEDTLRTSKHTSKMKLSNSDPFCIFATGCHGLSPKDIKTPDLNSFPTLEKCLGDLAFNPEYFDNSANAPEVEQARTERTEEDIKMLAPCATPGSGLEFVSRMRYLPAALQEAINSSLPSPDEIQMNAIEEEDSDAEDLGDSSAKERPTLALAIPINKSRFWRRRLSSWEFVDDTDAAWELEDEIFPSESSEINNAVLDQLTEQFETTIPSPSSAQLSYMSRAVCGSFAPPSRSPTPEEFAPITRDWKAEEFLEAESSADADDVLQPSPCYFLDDTLEPSQTLKSKLKAKGASILKPFRRTRKQQPPPVTARQAQILAEACRPRARSCSSFGSTLSASSAEFVEVRGGEKVSLC